MPPPTATRHGVGRTSVAAAGLLLAALMAGPGVESGAAVEIPPAGGFYIQTGGQNAGVGIGDWYTSDDAGAGSGFHYITITVPCGWPSGTPLHIDLFSPEMNQVAGALGQGDEPRNNYDFTQFELYGPNATIGPGYDQPALGGPGSLGPVTYSPGAAPEAWVRFATLTPATCGTYVLRSAVLTTAPGEGDDDNGWRLRVGSDNDGLPNNPPPPNSDNPDGVPGTNDELIVGQVQITYQQSVGGLQCLTLYQYIPPGQASATLNNFDLDASGPPTLVTYYAPSDTFDPTGQVGGTAGTLSISGQWNQGTIARGGDTIANPEAGWWRIVTCLSANNQFIQEAQAGVGVYFSQPPIPTLAIGKTDGTTVAPAGGDLTYVITVTNTSSGPTAGAAHAVVVTDTIPTNSTFVGCMIVPPATGSCSNSLGLVTAALDGWINAGDSVDVEITVTVDPDATGTVSNDASVMYEDVLGNPFPAVTASDVDSVGPPVPTATPSPTPAQTPIPTIPDTGVGGIRGEQPGQSPVGALLGVLLVALLGLGWLVVRRQRPTVPRWVR